MVEGTLVGKLIGLANVRATLAMLRTPDGLGIKLDKFHTPESIWFGPVDAPVGIRRNLAASRRACPKSHQHDLTHTLT
jgi:hypothetical protein